MKTKVMQARVSEKFLERVDEEAEKRGLSRSDFIIYALEFQMNEGEIYPEKEEKIYE